MHVDGFCVSGVGLQNRFLLADGLLKQCLRAREITPVTKLLGEVEQSNTQTLAIDGRRVFLDQPLPGLDGGGEGSLCLSPASPASEAQTIRVRSVRQFVLETGSAWEILNELSARMESLEAEFLALLVRCVDETSAAGQLP